MFNLQILQELGIELLFTFLCSALIYYSGDVMIYISNHHVDKEWINRIIAFIDIILITIVLVLVLRIMIIVLPYVLMLLICIIIIAAVVILASLLINKIHNIIRK